MQEKVFLALPDRERVRVCSCLCSTMERINSAKQSQILFSTTIKKWKIWLNGKTSIEQSGTRTLFILGCLQQLASTIILPNVSLVLWHNAEANIRVTSPPFLVLQIAQPNIFRRRHFAVHFEALRIRRSGW